MEEIIKGQSSFTIKFLKVKRRIQTAINVIKKIKSKCYIFFNSLQSLRFRDPTEIFLQPDFDIFIHCLEGHDKITGNKTYKALQNLQIN